MIYKLPTNVYFEENCVLNNAKVFATLGKNALIVTSKSAHKNDSLDDVKKALKEVEVNYYVYDSILQNPTVEQIMEIREFYKETKIDFVIGIGGGSAMDAAKAVAVMLYHKEKEADWLYNKQTDHKSLPVIAIPTTCGTGSEVTAVSVLTRNDVKTKQSMTSKIFPMYAFVDIKYLKTLPGNILANTSIDAFAHLVESYISTNATDFSNMFVKEGLTIWGKSKKSLLQDSKTNEDYYNLMLASVLAGMSIAHCGTSLPHGASYVLTYDLKIPHGKACAYFLASYIECSQKEKIDNILSWTGFESVGQLRTFIEQVCNLTALSKDIVEKCLNVLLSNPAKLANSPLDNSEETVKKVVSYYIEK